MGSRMALNLHRKGHAVRVWNRTRARAEPLLAEGLGWAESPAEAARFADVTFTCLADGPAMQAVLHGTHGLAQGLSRGKVWVDCSTLSPDDARAHERLCNDLGARFLAAPVTGSKGGAEAGTLTLMCGGDAALFEELRPLLAAFSGKQILVGDAVQAAQVKLVGNVLIAHMMEGLAEGAALCRKANVPFEKLLEVVAASGYASPYWAFKGAPLARGDWSTHFSIDLMHKDLSLALETGRELGVPMPGTAAVREVYALARAQGFGSEDIVATAKVVDPAAGRKS